MLVAFNVDDDVGALFDLTIDEHADDGLDVSKRLTAPPDQQTCVGTFDFEHQVTIAEVVQHVCLDVDVHSCDEIPEYLAGGCFKFFAVFNHDRLSLSRARVRASCAVGTSGRIAGIVAVAIATVARPLVSLPPLPLPVRCRLTVALSSRTFARSFILIRAVLSVIGCSVDIPVSPTLVVAAPSRLPTIVSRFGRLRNASRLVHLSLTFGGFPRLLFDDVFEPGDLNFGESPAEAEDAATPGIDDSNVDVFELGA